MEITEANIVLHQNVEGACYVSDKFGNLIGWYDYNSKVLKVDDRYKYTDKLIENCTNANFQIIFEPIKDDEVLKYFAQRRIKVRQYLINKKKHNEWLDEQLKVMPTKKRIKKVKNAAQKINKRHG